MNNKLLFLCLLGLMTSLFSYNCSPPESKNNTPSRIDILIQNQIILAEAKSDSGDNETAIQIMKTVLSDKNFETAMDSSKSNAFHKLGHYAYQAGFIKAAHFEKALPFLKKAISLRTSDSNHIATDLANSYYVRALVHEKLLDYKKAIDDIFVAIKTVENNNPLSHDLGKYYSKAGLFLLRYGETDRAKQYLDQALDILNPNSREMGEYFNNLAEYYYNNKNIKKAKENYAKSIDVFLKLPNEENNLYFAKFNALSLNYQKLNYKEGKKIQLKFLSEFEAHNDFLTELKRKGYNNLAWFALEHNKIEEAGNYYEKVLKFAQQLNQSKNSVNIARSYEGLGDVDAAKGKYDASIQNYHKAIQSLCISFNSDDPYALPSIQNHVVIDNDELVRILGFKADAIYKKYNTKHQHSDLEATFQSYKIIDQLLVQIRQSYKAASSRYALISETLSFYEKATEVSLALFEKTKRKEYLTAAFSFATKNKAVVLLDGIQDEQAKSAGIPSKILDKENKLKKEIYRLKGEIYALNNTQKKDTEALNQLIKKRFNKTRKYEDLITDLEKEYPEYFQLKYVSQKTDVENLINQLPDDAVILEYFIGNKNIYTFVISKQNGLEYFVKKKNKKFNKNCLAFRAMTEKDSIQDLVSFSEVSFSLYDVLLEQPLLNIEKEKTINRLFIIPDGRLMQISFDPFLTERLDTTFSGEWINKLPFLLHKYAISYAYSNQLLFNQVAKNRIDEALNQYIGFGLEYDDYTLEAIENLQSIKASNTSSRGMGKLLHSVDEILKSEEIFGGESYLDQEATKSNFINQAPTARLLHIAAHGFVVKDKPLNSGFIFTKQNKSTDFILRAADIYTMKLKADMAVLSACHTGDGRIQRGEGIRSLARAFNYAGCPNVTASLWGAPDKSTKEIMLSLYRFIKEGKPKDIALQEAKLEYIDNCGYAKEALPCNWAHLVTIGDVQVIHL